MTTDLDDLESQYQKQQVLTDDTGVTFAITDVRISEAKTTYLTLTLDDDTEYVLSMPAGTPSFLDIETLFEVADLEFGADLSALVGTDVTVQFGEDLQSATVLDGDVGPYDVVPHSQRDTVDASRTTLPADVVTAVERLSAYRAGDGVQQSRAVDVDADDETLVIDFEFPGGPLTWELPVPSPAEMSDSTYERVVEELGYGSVTQIRDGTVYVARLDRFDVDESAVKNCLGVVHDPLSRWGLFLSESAARTPLLTSDAFKAKFRSGDYQQFANAEKPLFRTYRLLRGSRYVAAAALVVLFAGGVVLGNRTLIQVGVLVAFVSLVVLGVSKATLET